MKNKLLLIIPVLLVIIGAFGFILWNNRTISTITMDINPSIEIHLNKRNKVKKVVALNKDAKEYIPTKKRIPEKIDFNLTAIEYRPKLAVEYIEADDDDDEEEDVKEKMDMIVKDMVESEVMEEMGNEVSEDEEKWLPEYKDCECCHGFVFKCNGITCADLGQCYCKMKDDCDKHESKKS